MYIHIYTHIYTYTRTLTKKCFRYDSGYNLNGCGNHTSGTAAITSNQIVQNTSFCYACIYIWMWIYIYIYRYILYAICNMQYAIGWQASSLAIKRANIITCMHVSRPPYRHNGTNTKQVVNKSAPAGNEKL